MRIPKKVGRKSNAVKAAEAAAAEQAQRAKEIASNRSDAQILKDIEEMFADMRVLIQGMASTGSPRSLIISGAPGIGKSHTYLDVLQNEADCPMEVVQGSISPINLYMLGWRNREEGSVVVLDDSDKILWDEEGVGLLKALTETRDPRTVSYLKEARALKEQEVDQQYDFGGSFLFVTNTNFQPILDEGRHRIVEHLRALVSRSLYFDTGLHDRPVIGIHVRNVTVRAKLCQNIGVSDKVTTEILDWIGEHQNEVRELSLRTPIHLAELAKGAPAIWKRIAERTLLRNRSV